MSPTDGIPPWRVVGDWFDVCNCKIPCPCTWAEAPTQDQCTGVLAWHVREGHYGDIRLDGLNLIVIGTFEGTLWGGDGHGTAAAFLDERADDAQRDAMGMVFGGEAGGWPATYAHLLHAENVGFDFVPIQFEVADDLSWWRAEVPGRVTARADALTGPTAPPGTLVQVLNPPGSDTGPGQVATWGRVVANQVDAFGLRWEFSGTSSKHIPFDWSGPDG